MQTPREIKSLLSSCGARPNKLFGQCFMTDRNVMDKFIRFASLDEKLTILEIGPGTGSLTSELLACKPGRLLACEIDQRLCGLLRSLFGTNEAFELVEGDVLASKHCISPDVLASLGPGPASMVSNLPYNIATPVVAECLIETWRTATGNGDHSVSFDRLVFTVQNEVAQRFAAVQGKTYGPVSVVISLLGNVTPGPMVSSGSFWPEPSVSSRIMKIDFNHQAATRLKSIDVLSELLKQCFTQRRKAIVASGKARGAPYGGKVLSAALSEAGIDSSTRPDMVCAEDYLRLANLLT